MGWKMVGAALFVALLLVEPGLAAADIPSGSNATQIADPEVMQGAVVSRYEDLRARHQHLRADIRKLVDFGYKTQVMEGNLGRAGELLDDAGARLDDAQVSEKLTLAESKLDQVRVYAVNSVSARYYVISREQPDNVELLNQAEGLLDSGDFFKAAEILHDMEEKAAKPQRNSSDLNPVFLVALLVSIGVVSYYKKDRVRLGVEDMTHRSIAIQFEDLQSRTKALLGKRVSIRGTVLTHVARAGGFWIKISDKGNDALVWSREDVPKGQKVEIHGIVSHDKDLDLWYVDARIVRLLRS